MSLKVQNTSLKSNTVYYWYVIFFCLCMQVCECTFVYRTSFKKERALGTVRNNEVQSMQVKHVIMNVSLRLDDKLIL